MKPEPVELRVGDTVGVVDGLFCTPGQARALYVFAHGAGANMHHAFMRTMAERLADVGVATLRYNFPYMQAGGKRPDPPGVLEATVRAAIDKGAELAAGSTLIAGGKSMGGRMTSNTLAKRADERVSGIVFLGFPLHQPGKPGLERAAHLDDVAQRMLFIQGTRDSLARIDLIRSLCESLGDRATLHIIEDGDHSFAVPKRSGRTAADVQDEVVGRIAEWAGAAGPPDHN